MDYHHVEQLFDMIANYYQDKPPPEEQAAHGQWVKVRDGLEGAEHCIRVLTPEEFDEWHRCLELPVQVAFGRKPVAYCNHEGVWWVIYEDTDESEVIGQFEKCFEGSPAEKVSAALEKKGCSTADESASEISRFFGMVISMPQGDPPPPRFHATYGSEKVEFCIAPPGLLEGKMSPRALAIVAEWAVLREKELLEAWEDRAAGRTPRKIEPLL